jgi:histidyl-tRNA synthetase
MLLSELERDKVVQEMCRNGAYTGAAEFIETWVFSEQEHMALLEEAKTLPNYEDKTFFEQLHEVEALVAEVNSTPVEEPKASKKERPSMAKQLRDRMEEEFGKELWNNAD